MHPFITSAQRTDYDQKWKKVEQLLLKDELPKSALDEVRGIYTLAEAEKNEPQMLKALVYRLNISAQITEASPESTMLELESVAGKSAQPIQQLMYSLLADAYHQYFQNNRYKIYNRTNTAGFKKEDIGTWTADDLHRAISRYYRLSLSNTTLLQQISVTQWDAMIIKGNTRQLRPTLFDLLAHRALNYFENDEQYISKPAFAFHIKDSMAFATAALFRTHVFATNDTVSNHYHALLLYQQLIRFHLNDEHPDALLDADISRLNFVHSMSSHLRKEELYRSSLQQLAEKYGDHPAAAQAWYLLAEIYANEAADYNSSLPETSKLRYQYGKAIEICRKVLLQKQDSEGRYNCNMLLQRIMEKSLMLQTEMVNPIDQPFRALVTYRNVDKFHVRIIELTKDLKESITGNHWDQQYWEKITDLHPQLTRSFVLPAIDDHQQHRVEIKMDGLPAGEYLLLASDDSSFSTSAKTKLIAGHFYVSNIAWINNGEDYFVLHRETGLPLHEASVQVYEQTYDYQLRKTQFLPREKFLTDKNGHFKLITAAARSGSVLLEVMYKGDRLMPENFAETSTFYERKPADEEQEKPKVFLFTDRSIYRPGQTVYFKGIAVSGKNEKAAVVADYNARLYLTNANYQSADSLFLSTNKYGSFSGSFRIPVNVRTGRFVIQDKISGNETGIQVEEYKRPKFYVEYEKIKGTYRLLDTISVHGFAQAYAGNRINAARVSYRVFREVRFPYPVVARRWGWPSIAVQEMTSGIASTDVEGRFSIEFIAIPDEKIRREQQPVFHYRIVADVTDINGETRSEETIVPVGYQSLQLQIADNERIYFKEGPQKDINLKTSNLSGIFEPALVTVKLYPLRAPARLIRNRYWLCPDQFLYSAAEYRQWFPYDEYNCETDVASWPRGNVLMERTDSSRANGKFNLGMMLKKGWYLLEASTYDKDGNPVQQQYYVHCSGADGITPAHPQYLWRTDVEDVLTAAPGNNISIQRGTSAENVFMITIADRMGLNDVPYNYQLASQKSIAFPVTVTEHDRGGLGVYTAFVKHNRFFTTATRVDIPWSNKELNITLSSFRDKTLPGSNETWKVNITGFNKEKVAAELLTALYDASLDQFKQHSWSRPSLFSSYYISKSFKATGFQERSANERYSPSAGPDFFRKSYDQLLPLKLEEQIQYKRVYAAAQVQKSEMAKDNVQLNEAVTVKIRGNVSVAEERKPATNDAVQIRKDFRETAFFFPDLKTDSSGNIQFSFTMPEALTRWKWMLLAHTEQMATAYLQQDIITQKQLMVQPFAPRFLREGDLIEFTAKISNLTDAELSGQAVLELLDAKTMKPVDGWFQNTFPLQYFTAAAQQSTVVNFRMQIPVNFNSTLVYRVTARAGAFSDGEEAMLPVLTNRMLVTETLPLSLRGNQTKTYQFEKLAKSKASESLTHHQLLVEFTSNPVWYAVQSLPFIIEYPYECTEQTWNRFYANALASMIANAHPRIRQVFEAWKKDGSKALLSPLQQNEELKAVLLQETPWLLQGLKEEEQKKNIALLFDMARMTNEMEKVLNKVSEMQSPNGGFVWFKGGPDDRYITQYIVSSMGHLMHLKAVPPAFREKADSMAARAIRYLDNRIAEDYAHLIRNKISLRKNNLSAIQIHYLYMRSFFPETEIGSHAKTAYRYYLRQAGTYWTKNSKYLQGMTALVLHRASQVKQRNNILKSLQETSTYNEETGRYWKAVQQGFYWHQDPVITQALMIELFNEVNQTDFAEELKRWLLTQKQTRHWGSTVATAEACYALLQGKNNWLESAPEISITMGSETFGSETETTEAGTGYFSKRFDAAAVKPDMSEITVKSSKSNSDQLPMWGGGYWQYFENLDNITPAATGLQLKRSYFVERNTERGPMLYLLDEQEKVYPGDKIKVRIELKSDRYLEYVHMKDMRPSCTEPVNVISSYKWQDGLGYYESTKDASTNFFFSYLPQGTYVFEYALFVTHAGNFSTGISSVQCMYAPSFSSHSEGTRIYVEERR